MGLLQGATYCVCCTGVSMYMYEYGVHTLCLTTRVEHNDRWVIIMVSYQCLFGFYGVVVLVCLWTTEYKATMED